MPKYPFSTTGQAMLLTCRKELQDLFNEVADHVNCKVLDGHRDEQTQNEAFAKKTSTVPWPNSKHNSLPSLAVDVAPYPIEWPDVSKMDKEEYARSLGRWYMFVGLVRGIAARRGIKIRCGADWDGDMEVKDQNFHDLPHFELVED